MNETRNAGLVDVLDCLIDNGAVVDGDIVVRMADLDLLLIRLRLLITSISRQEKIQGGRVGDINRNELGDEVFIKRLQGEIKKTGEHINKMINADKPEVAEAGLSQLVLTLIKLIVDLVEREVMRRMELGYLTEKEIEKIGVNLDAIEKKIEELRLMFGIKEEDLNLDLGPLGKLR